MGKETLEVRIKSYEHYICLEHNIAKEAISTYKIYMEITFTKYDLCGDNIEEFRILFVR